MGCLKNIVKNIILICIIVAFFAFGGWSFLSGKINKYKNPKRADFIKSQINFADFSYIDSDYQLMRNFNFFGYKKITAKYLPTNQKIIILNLKEKEVISQDDFKNQDIDKKIEYFLNKSKDCVVSFEEFKIVSKGFYQAKNKKIPYLTFNSKIKNIPFKVVSGDLALIEYVDKKTNKKQTSLVFLMTDLKSYNPVIVKNFIQALKF